jgi:hypothetical protein
MSTHSDHTLEEAIAAKVHSLPVEAKREVLTFVDFIAMRASAHAPHAGEALPNPYILPPEITDPAERAATLGDVARQMKENSFTGDPPRFTREELHERR